MSEAFEKAKALWAKDEIEYGNESSDNAFDVGWNAAIEACIADFDNVWMQNRTMEELSERFCKLKQEQDDG